LTRDRANPAHIDVNDVLGNYSLSVVDSLSTLAILASDPVSDTDDYNALDDFQHYVHLVTEEYGDGSPGPAGQGRRARGFDLDSKVQVFETTICLPLVNCPFVAMNPTFKRMEYTGQMGSYTMGNCCDLPKTWVSDFYPPSIHQLDCLIPG
jgi:hypothetical protein